MDKTGKPMISYRIRADDFVCQCPACFLEGVMRESDMRIDKDAMKRFKAYAHADADPACPTVN